MNCRTARHDIFRERDGMLDSSGQSALLEHVTHCAACRGVRENIGAAVDAWRGTVDNVRVPDANIEWQKVRREIRQESRPGASARPSLVKWLALPLATAAALAVALFVSTSSPENDGQATSIGAISGPADGSAPADAASTVVFVDDKTGWVFVWADEGAKHI